MSETLLKAGLHPAASDALRSLGIDVSRISQTIGDAPASAGSHAADGAVDGEHYCAATDLRIRDLTDLQVRQLADKLASVGFAPFPRFPGRDHWPATEVKHLHTVWCGCHMKAMLRRQVHDFCAIPNRNGLASHAPYLFWHPHQSSVQVCRELFLAHNPAVG